MKLNLIKFLEKIGIEKILWEPMSVGREYGETIEKCEILQKLTNVIYIVRRIRYKITIIDKVDKI